MIITLIIIACIIACSIWVYKSDSDESIFLLVLSCIVAFIALIIILCANTFQEKEKVKWEERRKALVYEMDNGFYVGDSLGDFNGDLKEKQIFHKNPWTSWFVGKYIMEIEPIETEKEK